MKSMFLMFSACVFALFCFLEMRGVTWDTNQRTPAPQIYTSRSSSSSGYRGGSSWGYFSSK